MKRKNIINLLGLIVLVVLTAIILINNKKDSTLSEKHTDFTISDTGSITKIFIADMKGETATLTKTDNKWMVNDQFPVNRTRIENLLTLLTKIEIKSVTPETAMDNIIRELASSGIKAEIYTNKDKPYKTYYIGGPTPDQLGTIMALDLGGKSDKVPYIVHDPTFEGYLSDGYFFTDESEWRSKVVFPFAPTKIAKAEVSYLQFPEHSFTILKSGSNQFVLKTLDGIEQNKDSLNDQQIKKFLMGFDNFQFVAVDEEVKPQLKDSMMNATPVIKVDLENDEGLKFGLNLYFKPSDLRTKVELMEGVDKEFYYGVASDRSEDILIFQALTLSRILWKFEDFKIKK